MDTQNDGLENVSPFKYGPFLVSMLNMLEIFPSWPFRSSIFKNLYINIYYIYIIYLFIYIYIYLSIFMLLDHPSGFFSGLTAFMQNSEEVRQVSKPSSPSKFEGACWGCGPLADPSVHHCWPHLSTSPAHMSECFFSFWKDDLVLIYALHILFLCCFWECHLQQLLYSLFHVSAPLKMPIRNHQITKASASSHSSVYDGSPHFA